MEVRPMSPGKKALDKRFIMNHLPPGVAEVTKPLRGNLETSYAPTITLILSYNRITFKSP